MESFQQREQDVVLSLNAGSETPLSMAHPPSATPRKARDSMKKTLFKHVLSVAALATLAACGGGGGGSDAPSTPNPASPTNPSVPSTPGTPTTPVTPPSTTIVDAVPAATYAAGTAEAAVFKVLNAERSTCGFGKVAQSAQLDVAAQGQASYQKLRADEGVIVAGHDQDPAKSGFVAVTIPERVAKTGYNAAASTEDISQYFIGSTADYGNSLTRVLLGSVYHARSVLDGWRDMGASVTYASGAPAGYQLATLAWVGGTQSGQAQQQAADVVTYPCQGTSGVHPYMFPESPEPFAGLGFTSGDTVGHPIFVRAPQGKVLTIATATVTSSGGKVVPVLVYTAAIDPNKLVQNNEAFVVPREPLALGGSYTVQVQGDISGVAFTRTFTFSTISAW